MAEKIHSGESIKHDSNLEASFGPFIPQPKLSRGEFVAIGELAGSTSTAKEVSGKKDIHFQDSFESAT